ncbi:hypothetical protein G210_5099 [Candida maltosa Xu316]|uniref:F-box domain-containing protein n=1 Tax=Candida maltosa (strain Xu316) TaxID=1245528 RepID=M3K581_CANMX|nr:hypothetical protein G210_5099 [Candida maltosa Xu316]
MSDSLLSQLPLEILGTIISYLPRSELYKLDGIDYLKQFVLNNIYSSVRIKKEEPVYEGWNEDRFGETIFSSEFGKLNPRFACFKGLTDFLEENHIPFPKCIEFEYPIDIIHVYDANPIILQDCIIETSLEVFCESRKYSFELRKFYLEKLISLPLKIRSVEKCEILHELMPESSLQFTRKLTTAHFSKEFPLETVFENDAYQNLINLTLKFPISHEMVTLIPRSVKKLNCEIVYPGIELSEFDFPSGLRSLSITLANFPEGYSVNFSYLERLVILEFNVKQSNERIPYYNVTFPKSLKSVKSSALDLEEIKNQCPELTCFDCRGKTNAEGKSNNITFPEKLTHLYVDGGTLDNIEKVKDNPSVIQVNDSKKRKIFNSTLFKFPKNLQRLRVVGDSTEPCCYKSQFLFSNSEQHILHKLTSLSLYKPEGFARFGPIPRSLTELWIILPKYDTGILINDVFDDLKNLTNLRLLRIDGVFDEYFDYELPPKLQLFDFTNPRLCKIRIRSETLKRLRLSEAKFNFVTPENFQIPESLVELHLVSCLLYRFDERFEFPENLQILNSHGNTSDYSYPELPQNLKILSSTYEAKFLDQCYIDELPTSLEELNLVKWMELRDYLDLFDLTHLVNLRKFRYCVVSSDETNIQEINLDDIPKSITELSMSGFHVNKIKGSFKDFPNLVHLDLSLNELNGWLQSSPDGFQFCDKIETIVLWNNQLDIETVRKLVYDLKKKPNFKSLVIDEDLSIPEDMMSLVIEDYLVIPDTYY